MRTPFHLYERSHSHINGTSVPWVMHGGQCLPLCNVTGVTVEMSPRSQRGTHADVEGWEEI